MKINVSTISTTFLFIVLVYIAFTIKMYFYWNEFGEKYWKITSSIPIEKKYKDAIKSERLIKVNWDYKINSVYIENDSTYICSDNLYGKIFVVGNKVRENAWYHSEYYSKDSIVVSYSKYGKKIFLYFSSFKPRNIVNKKCLLEKGLSL